MPLLFPIDREIEGKDEPASNAGLIDGERKRANGDKIRYARIRVRTLIEKRGLTTKIIEPDVCVIYAQRVE